MALTPSHWTRFRSLTGAQAAAIEVLVLLNEPVHGELLRYALAGGGAQTLGKRAVLEQANDRGGDGMGVMRIAEQADHAVLDYVGPGPASPATTGLPMAMPSSQATGRASMWEG